MEKKISKYIGTVRMRLKSPLYHRIGPIIRRFSSRQTLKESSEQKQAKTFVPFHKFAQNIQIPSQPPPETNNTKQ